MKYEVTSATTNITKVMEYEAVRVMINSNSTEKMRENFKKLDDLQINDVINMTDNYGSMGHGAIIIERIA